MIVGTNKFTARFCAVGFVPEECRMDGIVAKRMAITQRDSSMIATRGATPTILNTDGKVEPTMLSVCSLLFRLAAAWSSNRCNRFCFLASRARSRNCHDLPRRSKGLQVHHVCDLCDLNNLQLLLNSLPPTSSCRCRCCCLGASLHQSYEIVDVRSHIAGHGAEGSRIRGAQV